MALKVIKLRQSLKIAEKELEQLRAADEVKTFETREAELKAAFEQAESQEDIDLIDAEMKEFDEKRSAFQTKEKEFTDKITELRSELEAIESEQPESPKKNEERSKEPVQVRTVTTGGIETMANTIETRSQMLERLNQTEVREFYANVAKAVKDKRAVTESDLLIPETVINMIQMRLGDYSVLYKEVNVVKLSGTARVILDGKIPEAIWTEMCDPVEELAFGFSQTEIDGFKVGGFIPVCNAVLEDAMINLANYIEQRLAMAIAKSLDKAILIGEGASAKQPEGIITNTDVATATSTGELVDIMKNVGTIDHGDDALDKGELIAVMKRSTYYTHLMEQTYLPTADGRLVVQDATSPRLPDGTRVVFSNYAPENVIVIGDFKKYLLGERAGVKLAVSQDVRFIQDQTVFKGTARYDGKVVDKEAFVVITIEKTEVETP